jgi:hypothetical protein
MADMVWCSACKQLQGPGTFAGLQALAAAAAFKLGMAAWHPSNTGTTCFVRNVSVQKSTVQSSESR